MKTTTPQKRSPVSQKERTRRTYRVLIIVFSVFLILSMVLALFAK